MRILEGVNPDNGQFIFNYEADDENSIVDLVGEPINNGELFNNYVYYFGYKFRENISSKVRSRFIDYIKGYSDPAITKKDLANFIGRPISALHRKINLSNIDVIIYPQSQLNNLNNEIVDTIISYMPHDKRYLSYRVVKNVPDQVEFDYEAFAAHCEGEDTQKYKDSLQPIADMIDKIHSLDYFSIAKAVKPKYRKYIKNYLKPETANAETIMNAQNVLIVDDINTSGSTLQEILRIVTQINSDCNIYIYTLIGR